MEKNLVIPYMHELYDSMDLVSSCFYLTPNEEDALFVVENSKHRNISSFIIKTDNVFKSVCEKIENLDSSTTLIIASSKFSNNFYLGTLKKDGYRILVVED